MQSKPTTRSMPPSAVSSSCRVLLGGAENVARTGDGENQTFVDGAEERQAAVGVHVADRAAVVVAADLHHERVGREAEGAEIVGKQPDGRRILARRRLGVELVDDAVFRVGGGDDELDAGRLEVLRLEDAERIVALDHHQDGGAVRDGAVVDHDRALEAGAVARRAADQLDVVDLPMDGGDDVLFGVGQAVDQQQREHVVRGAGAPPWATRAP